MLTCYVCNFKGSSINKLIQHFKTVHQLSSNSLYKCKETDCVRSFSSLNSFRKHVTSKHIPKISVNKPIPEIKSLLLNSSNNDFPHNEPCHSENNIADDLFNSLNFDINRIKMFLSEQTLKFVCGLYNESTFTRKQVQNIVTQLKYFLSVCLEFLSETFIVDFASVIVMKHKRFVTKTLRS